jgi:hypothetical protein
MMGVVELTASIKPYFRQGRLLAVPRRRTARLAVLDLLANEFEPGRRYSETKVNSVLATYYRDFCALRRYLVDEGFLERSEGVYWRVGGTFDVS